MKIETLEQAKRAAFMGAYRGLRSQGWERSVDDLAEANQFSPYSICRYDGSNGRHCAVGWLLKTRGVRNSKPMFQICEDDLAAPLRSWFKASDESIKDAFAGYLLYLQNAHDAGLTPAQMANNFEQIQEEHGWPVPSEVV